MLIRNPAFLQAVIAQAVEDSYHSEVIETDMESITIGPDSEYPTKKDWIGDRLSYWAEQASEKLKEAGKSIADNSGSREVAIKYYELELGGTFKLPNGIEVTRVPGGWIHHQVQYGCVINAFVPYADEYQSLTVEGKI